MEEFKEKTEQEILKEKLRFLISETANKYGAKIFMDKILEKSKDLKIKHKDYIEYISYHIFIGSTPPDYATQFDFPGDDSIIKYLESLLE